MEPDNHTPEIVRSFRASLRDGGGPSIWFRGPPWAALRPYDDIESGALTGSAEDLEAAWTVLRDGWRRDDGTSLLISSAIDWPEESVAYDLHSWRPIGKVIAAADIFGERGLLDAAIAYVDGWLAFVAEPGSRVPAVIDQDMATGMRAIKLAYLLDVCRRAPATDSRAHTYAALLDAHVQILIADGKFASHSNHGLYQAIALYAIAVRFPEIERWHRYKEKSETLLRTMCEVQFTHEGVHREHSPGYQYMVLSTLLAAARAGLLPASIEPQLNDIESALYWMIMPDGVIAPIGDTNPRNLRRRRERTSQFNNPALIDLLVNGLDHRPVESIKVYAESGYAFARSYDLNRGHSYLAYQAGFHSRVHKHADSLSFIWFDRSKPILVDPGSFSYGRRLEPNDPLRAEGYWYEDPRRQYVESTRAHSCLEVGGRNEPRVVTIFPGSLLTNCFEVGDHVRFSAEYPRPDGVMQRRLIVLRPGRWLLVVDHVRPTGILGTTVKQNFCFAPSWVLNQQSGPRTWNLATADDDDLWMSCASSLGGGSLSQERGVQEPAFLGWVSNSDGQLVPSTLTSFTLEIDQPAVIASLFELDVPTAAEDLRIETHGEKVSVVWKNGVRESRVDLDLEFDGEA